MPRRFLITTALVATLAILSIATASNAYACKNCNACKAKVAAESAKEAPHNVAPEGWTALFNGKDIEGWVVKSGFCPYEVKDGMITGTTAKGSGNTFLTTPNKYGDFELKFDTLLHDGGLNSGVQIRSQIVKEGKHGGRIGGPQVEIASNGKSGFIYGEASTRRWMTEKVKELNHKHFIVGEWNTYHVIAKGNTITTKINGHEIATTVLPDDFQEKFAKGVIGLQVHSVGGDPKWKVSWRNIYIKELK